MSLENPEPTAISPAPELGRRALSPDRWLLLVEHVRKAYNDASQFEKYTVFEAVEIEGITFLPAVYYPA